MNTESETITLGDYPWPVRIYLRFRLAWFAFTVRNCDRITFHNPKPAVTFEERR